MKNTPDDSLDEITRQARIELVMRKRQGELHAMPADFPPIPHVDDVTCWCQPELVFKRRHKVIYRHKRQQ